jgi:hypothetical protein
MWTPHVIPSERSESRDLLLPSGERRAASKQLSSGERSAGEHSAVSYVPAISRAILD